MKNALQRVIGDGRFVSGSETCIPGGAVQVFNLIYGTACEGENWCCDLQRMAGVDVYQHQPMIALWRWEKIEDALESPLLESTVGFKTKGKRGISPLPLLIIKMVIAI